MTKLEIRDEWIKRLESGEIKQTTGTLGSIDGSRCCLGVLCDIAVEQKIIPEPKIDGCLLYYDEASTLLPLDITTWAGVRTCSARYITPRPDEPGYDILRRNRLAFRNDSSLADLNDLGMSFEDVAAFIKANPKELFINEI